MSQCPRIILVALTVLALWTSVPAGAGQIVLSDYQRTVSVVFWPQLYRNGGETLYCRQPFSNTLGLTVEHVYPMRWVELALDCDHSQACRADHAAYGYMESDLHNLYVTRLGTADARGDLAFGFVPGDRRDFGADCNFKVAIPMGLCPAAAWRLRGDRACLALHGVCLWFAAA